MNLLSLNINGFGKREFKLKWVNNLVNSHRIPVVGIQETKRKVISDLMVKRLWGSNDYEFEFCGSNGHSRGMLMCWNKNLFVKSHVICRNDCLVIQGS